MKNNKKILILVLFLMAVITITACNKTANKNEEQNDSYQFVKDSSLDRYIDPELQGKVLDSEPNANTPATYFINDNYVGVLCLKGILIFDKDSGKLNTVLDIAGLGFEQTQGDKAIIDDVYNDYLIFNKADEKNGYIYSFKEKALSKIDDISKVNLEKSADKIVQENEYEKIMSSIGSCVDPVKYNESFAALKIDEDNIKNSQVYVLDEKFNEVIKFSIGEN